MEPTFSLPSGLTKAERYAAFLEDYKNFINGEDDRLAALANTSAALREAFGFFWVGFYLEREGELRLGPFQGTLACMHIKIGRGVCGTSFEQQQSIVVPDVEQFPGHIACSSLSRSEIVVPIFDKTHRPVGVLDIDSTELNTFDECDRQNLERVCEIITKTLYS